MRNIVNIKGVINLIDPLGPSKLPREFFLELHILCGLIAPYVDFFFFLIKGANPQRYFFAKGMLLAT